jgi:hypothetical protein
MLGLETSDGGATFALDTVSSDSDVVDRAACADDAAVVLAEVGVQY